MDLNNLCKQVCNIAKTAGAFIREEVDALKKDDVISKGLHNYVTYVDKKSEEMIVEKLKPLLPEAGFIVEEETISKKGKEYNWVVDPLDGTTNYIHSLPCFSVSIALMYKDEVILGVVYEVNRDECFYAVKGEGAYLNGAGINVSKTESIEDSLLATGFPYYDYSRLNNYMSLFAWFLRNTRGVRRFGSAAVDLAYVACGRFDGFFEYSLNAWDVAAGSLIVEEAGGKVSDFEGSNNYLFGKEIIATNNLIFNIFLRKLKDSFSA